MVLECGKAKQRRQRLSCVSPKCELIAYGCVRGFARLPG